jgi:hypothetical protein
MSSFEKKKKIFNKINVVLLIFDHIPIDVKTIVRNHDPQKVGYLYSCNRFE